MSAFSTRATQEAQVMPSIGNVHAKALAGGGCITVGVFMVFLLGYTWLRWMQCQPFHDGKVKAVPKYPRRDGGHALRRLDLAIVARFTFQLSMISRRTA